MKNGLLNQFLKLFELKNLIIKLEVLTMLSSLVSDNSEGIEILLNVGNIIPKVIYLIKADHKDVIVPNQNKFLGSKARLLGTL
jgi:hypothetical protein